MLKKLKFFLTVPGSQPPPPPQHLQANIGLYKMAYLACARCGQHSSGDSVSRSYQTGVTLRGIAYNSGGNSGIGDPIKQESC